MVKRPKKSSSQDSTKSNKRKVKDKEDAKEMENSTGKASAMKQTEEENVGVRKDPTLVLSTIDFTIPKKTEEQLKIVTWNVAGWRSILMKGFAQYVLLESPDIICVQETKVSEKDVNEAILSGYYQHFHCSHKAGYSGTAIFSKIKPLNWTDGIEDEEFNTDGRSITAEYEDFFLVNAYVPNSSRGLVNLDKRQRWDIAFLKYLKQLKQRKSIILCGDMNVAHSEIDLANPETNRNRTAGFTDQEREGMTKLLSAGFVDSFRHLNPEAKGAYTFWSYFHSARTKNLGWRLDYFIVSIDLVTKFDACYMRTSVMGSDHCPVVLHIAPK